MLDFKILTEIGKIARESIKKDSDGYPIKGKGTHLIFFVFYTLIPLLAASTPWYWDIKLSKLEGYIGTGIAIFTGLFFSLLLNISSKIRIEKENKNKDIANFKGFKENMKQISDIAQYVIVLGILILLIVLVNALVCVNKDLTEKIFTSLALILLLRYFVCLFFILQRFHFVLRDEIDNIL